MDHNFYNKRRPKPRTYSVATEKLSTVPLFRVREDTGELDFEGSGVLLTFRNRHFLGTAAHVVDFPAGHSVHIGACSPAISLVGRTFQRNERGKPESEAIDFAVTELTVSEANALAEDSLFIPLDPATPYKPRFKHLHYRLTGFLADDNHANISKSTLSANGLRIIVKKDHTSLDHHPVRKLNKGWYVCGIYDAQKTISENWDHNQKPKSFKGFSGGSFFLDDPFCPGMFIQFAGIILECTGQDLKGRTILTGIGARAILDMLRHWYPDIEPALSSNHKSNILYTPQPVIYVLNKVS